MAEKDFGVIAFVGRGMKEKVKKPWNAREVAMNNVNIAVSILLDVYQAEQQDVKSVVIQCDGKTTKCDFKRWPKKKPETKLRVIDA